MWKEFNIKNIEEGVEYFFYNESWINEDYEDSKGIRIGHVCDDVCYTSYWNDYQDFYDCDEFSVPTHFMEIPKFEFIASSNQINLFE